VFGHLVAAVTSLAKCARKGLDAETATQAAEDLVAVSRLLALVAVEEAAASRDRQWASTRLAEGDAFAASGAYENAVRRYGKAWTLVA
jgi:hypothetical protein